jgi:hypothetical protein
MRERSQRDSILDGNYCGHEMVKSRRDEIGLRRMCPTPGYIYFHWEKAPIEDFILGILGISNFRHLKGVFVAAIQPI